MTFDMSTGVIGALLVGGTAPVTAPYCPSGNCTWPEFTTLGVCSACTDASNQNRIVSQTCSEEASPCPAGTGVGWDLTVANNAHLFRYGGMNISTAYGLTTSFFANVSEPIVNVTSLFQRNQGGAPSLPLFVTECVMYFCWQRIRSTVTAGKLTESVVSTWTDDQIPFYPDTAEMETGEPGMGGAGVASSTSGTVFRGLQNGLVDLLTAEEYVQMAEGGIEIYLPMGPFREIQGIGSTRTTQIIYQAQSGTVPVDGPDDNVEDNQSNNKTIPSVGLGNLLQNISISITNLMRNVDNTTAPVVGQLWNTEAIVHVRWIWFIYPIAVIILTLLFLVATIVQSSTPHIKVWKSSILAVLFHGLDDPVYDSSSGTLDNTHMKARAKQVKVEFMPRQETWRFVKW
jgi:hypothetical protein